MIRVSDANPTTKGAKRLEIEDRVTRNDAIFKLLRALRLFAMVLVQT